MATYIFLGLLGILICHVLVRYTLSPSLYIPCCFPVTYFHRLVAVTAWHVHQLAQPSAMHVTAAQPKVPVPVRSLGVKALVLALICILA
jgi:hypothetical protein